MSDRKLIVRLIGDTTSLQRAVRTSSVDLKAVGLSAQASARVQIAASVKKDARLREDIASYRAAAAAAQRGSREQIAAANLANRAQLHLSRSLGVTSHESASLSRSAKGAERDLGRVTRGALAGSGIFRGLGRSIAFASGGFLAFASAGQFLRSSIDAAKEAQVTQRQLGQQLKNNGLSFGAYRKQIDDTGLRLSALSGFTKDDLDAALTTILRSTRNVGKALRDEATAADLARARHISLSQAALILGKTEAGNTTLLRRQGFQISKNATVEQALATVRAKVAGQARAGSTEQERFGAVLHDTEVIVGAGLLPTLNKYLASGAHWLQQMDQSGRLQHDVNVVAGDFERVIRVVAGTVKAVDKITGSFTHTLKDLAGVWLLLKTRTQLIRWGFLEAGLSGVGTSAATATGEVRGLEAALVSLRSLGPIALVAGLGLGIDKLIQDARSKKTLGTSTGRGGQAGTVISQNGKFFIVSPQNAGRGGPGGLRQITPQQARALIGQPDVSGDSRITGGQGQHGALRGLSPAAVASVTRRAGISLQGRFNVDELRLANAELTKTSADNLRILRDEAAITREQIAHTKTLKDRTALTQRLVGIMGALKDAAKSASDSFTIPDKLNLLTARASATAGLGDDAVAARATKSFIEKAIGSGKLRGQALIDAYSQLGQIDSQISAAADQARQDQQKRLQDALAARSGRQFKALGLDATGSPLTPGVKALRRELGTVDSAISGTFLDTSKTQSVLAKIRRVLSGGLGAVTKDVRSQIKQMLDDLDQQLRDHSGGPLTKFQKANTAQIVAGLGLDPATQRALRARLAQIGAGGTVPNRGVGAFGSSINIQQPDVIARLELNLDGRKLESSVTRHQQRRRRRNPQQQRGFAGSR